MAATLLPVGNQAGHRTVRWASPQRRQLWQYDAVTSPVVDDMRIGLNNLHLWAHATQLQGKRILAGEPTTADAIVDSMLLATALRNLLRSAHLARLLTARYLQDSSPSSLGPDLSAAIDTFETAIPSITDLRNVLEHFDAYELGKGKLQKKELPDLVSAIGFEREEGGFVLRVGRHAADELGVPFNEFFRLDVAKAVEAAAQLHLDVYSILMQLPRVSPKS